MIVQKALVGNSDGIKVLTERVAEFGHPFFLYPSPYVWDEHEDTLSTSGAVGNNTHR